ncbi:MAG: protein-L-isoaspartate(D-aspartate) O-methyltransferase [Hyphomicrobium sp.]
MFGKTKSKQLRARMVAEQLAARDICDPLVLAAMEKVPREVFVEEEWREEAYGDGPLPIGEGQTISQPYIVAYMIQALKLKGGEKILEIGGGSGYAAAVLAQICDQVFTIERLESLVKIARSNLRIARISNVKVRHGDGTVGWVEEAPFDGILVSAGAPHVPEILKEQLKMGGRMIIPVGEDAYYQELLCVRRASESKYEEEYLTSVRFVPLIGVAGWKEGQTKIATE